MPRKQTEKSWSESTEGKAYETPQVIRYGALRDLTRGTAGQNPDPAPKTGSQV